MTVPSTEELQRLLDETPHETWRAEIDEGNDWWNVVPSRFGGSHTPVAEGMSQPVAELTAESRVLASEVIRLREEIEALRDECRRYPTSRGHFYADREITRILKGDQA